MTDTHELKIKKTLDVMTCIQRSILMGRINVSGQPRTQNGMPSALASHSVSLFPPLLMLFVMAINKQKSGKGSRGKKKKTGKGRRGKKKKKKGESSSNQVRLKKVTRKSVIFFSCLTLSIHAFLFNMFNLEFMCILVINNYLFWLQTNI